MERIIQGPTWDTDYGTAEQCAAYVGGIDQRVWRELDAANLIQPPAARRNRQAVWWHWTSAVVVRLTLTQLLGKLRRWRREQKNSVRKLKRTRRQRPPEDSAAPPE